MTEPAPGSAPEIRAAATESRHLIRSFFAATRTLAWHTGSLQERLADAYADHLLQVTANELPAELQGIFRQIEEQMTAVVDEAGDDPFRAAAAQLSEEEARGAIERIVVLFGRLVGNGAE
jgi:hypothetical protein